MDAWMDVYTIIYIIHTGFTGLGLFRKLLAAAETDGKKLLDSVFELGFKESEVQRAAWKRT